ncbi:MAG: hypothetical protein GVY24_08305 [Planctomycetes bacterium]|nr:hypothetical protein [Planctomycetota bacterium]
MGAAGRARGRGQDFAAITAFIAALVWPWALKFLWAPLVDALRGRWWGDRAWVLSMQGVMGLTLLPLAALDLQADRALVIGLLIGHALAATIQDVAIDAWAIRITPKPEHGRLNAAMAVGKYIGRWLFGAGLLFVWDALGRGVIFGGLVASIWATGALVLIAAPSPTAEAALRQRLRAFGTSLGGALSRRATWLGLGIALLSGAAFEALGAVAGPVMVQAGYATSEMAIVRSAWVAAMLLGAWLGGVIGDRVGHRRATGAALLLIAALVAAVAALHAADAAALTQAVAIGVVYVAIGVFIAVSYALFMDLTDPRIGGTQFSAFMGATNACEAWSAAAAGALAAALGFAPGMLLMTAASLLALPLLWGLREGEAGARIRHTSRSGRNGG